jgi:hypothetical protein
VTDPIAKRARGLAALFRVAREVTLAHPQIDEHALIEPHMREIIAGSSARRPQALDEYADRQEGRVVFNEMKVCRRASNISTARLRTIARSPIRSWTRWRQHNEICGQLVPVIRARTRLRPTYSSRFPDAQGAEESVMTKKAVTGGPSR